MVRSILPVSALLLGLLFLFFAHGVHSLILPLRGAQEGFSSFSLGLLGTGWAIGYVSGCLLTSQLVSRVGHIRAFSAMASLAGITILAQLLMMEPEYWIPLRAITGFCFAGAAMIVESWLSERSTPSNRGTIFGIYTMVNLVGMTAGQLSLTLGSTASFQFFVIGAVFYAMALIPTAISSTASPRPLVGVSLDIKGLWRNSPVAVFAVFMVGMSNSAFGTLAAVYGERIALSVATIALFTSIPVMAGAVAQIPVGYLSDRFDRRRVLIAIAALALIADAAFLALRPTDVSVNLVLAGIFGASIFAMYPVMVAHANDNAQGRNPIQISGGLLLVFGIGSIFGPLLAGAAMSASGPRGLFLLTAVAHVLIIAQAIYRIGKRAPVDAADKTGFVASPVTRTSTPQTIALAATEAEEREASIGASRAPSGADAPGTAPDPRPTEPGDTSGN